MATDIPASHRNLLNARIASLATVAPNGTPRASLIWFLYDEGKLKFSTNDTRLKARDLLRTPKASLLIADPNSEMRYLELHGTVTIEPDPDYAFADKLGAKYEADVRAYDEPGTTRYAFTLEPSAVYAADLS